MRNPIARISAVHSGLLQRLMMQEDYNLRSSLARSKTVQWDVQLVQFKNRGFSFEMLLNRSRDISTSLSILKNTWRFVAFLSI